MKKFDRYQTITTLVLMFILGLGVSCTRSLAVVTPQTGDPGLNTNTPTFTNTSTSTPTFTPTGSYTATPTNTGTDTNTPTITDTPTNTNSPTATPTSTFTNTPTPIVFENWEGPYASGNMWATFASCAQGTYISNPWTDSANAITTCYDSTPGDAHSGTYCWRSEISWTADSQQAQIAPDSAYGVDYGYPINISASVPNSVVFWLKSDTANTQFSFYLQDTSGSGSGSPLHSAYYQNGTGANYILTIPTANTWTQFVLPLAQGGGSGNWSLDPATMNWGSILDVGTVFQGPAGASYPSALTIYMDDYGFIP